MGMRSGRSRGRVGVLAAALGVGAGVGAAALAGAGEAWADDSAADVPSADSAQVQTGQIQTGRAAAAPGSAKRVGPRTSARSTPPSTVRAANARPAAVLNPAPGRPVSARIPANRVAPSAAAALPAYSRRQANSATGTAGPSAATQAASLASGSVTVNPSVSWDAGVLTGTLGATSSLPLSYSVVSRPSLGGKLGGGPLLPLTNFGEGGSFTYIPYVSTLTEPTQTESFRIMVLENSKFDQFVEKLLGPLGKLLVPQALAIIHRIPVVGDLLSPIIGSAKIVPFTVNPFTVAADRPTAFTYRMPSFDGTRISVNYFPALSVANGDAVSAPTVLAASGLACAANTDPNTLFGQLFPSQQFGSLTPGIKPLREDSWTSTDGGPSYDGGNGGYNVVTWDPRGEFASGGRLQIDNPMFEGRDVSEIITWLTSSANPAALQVKTSVAGNPLVGMTGGSYGGGIQLTTVDPRLDAIVPEISWNSLISSLYPNQNQFLTGFGTILAAALAFTGARVNPMVYQGIITGALTGYLTPTQRAFLSSVGPTSLLNQEHAPTLLFQGIQDVLFPLQQAVDSAETILSNPYDTPVKMVWFCGGHGTCTDPTNPNQDDNGMVDNLKWLDQYVAQDADNPADTIPAFQWYDQTGAYRTSSLLPFQDGFNQAPFTVNGSGGLLGIVPLLGGSGPHPIKDLPFSIANAGPALNALNLNVTPPVGSQVVGAPEISFSYTGLGTSRTVYAQLVDNTTGLVLGNVVTPIPVVLDGRQRTVSIPMADVAYTAGSGARLTLQITSSAVDYENFYTLGLVRISDLAVDLPIRALG